MPYVSGMIGANLEQLRKNWGWFLVIGILLGILGVICVIKAQTATTFSILVLGWILMISAVLWFVGVFWAISWQGFFLYVLNALLRGACGYLLIRHPNAGAEGVTMLLAALFIVGGLFRIIGAGVIRFPRWGWMVFSGVVAVALGVFLIATWPTASTYFVGIAVGVDLFFDGAALVGFSAAIQSLPEAHARPV